MADTPLLEVESSPLVPNVLKRFQSIVAHDKGGVFFVSITRPTPRAIGRFTRFGECGCGVAAVTKLPAGAL